MIGRIWNIVDKLLTWTETIIILALLAATVGIAFTQVIARQAGEGWVWADELVRYMVLWLGVMGAGPATRRHKHIAIDAFLILMPKHAKYWIRRVSDLMAALVVFLLVKATIDYIGFVGSERSLTLGVETGTLMWPVVGAFLWIGIRFLADAILGVQAEEEQDTETGPGEGRVQPA